MCNDTGGPRESTPWRAGPFYWRAWRVRTGSTSRGDGQITAGEGFTCVDLWSRTAAAAAAARERQGGAAPRTGSCSTQPVVVSQPRRQWALTVLRWCCSGQAGRTGSRSCRVAAFALFKFSCFSLFFFKVSTFSPLLPLSTLFSSSLLLLLCDPLSPHLQLFFYHHHTMSAALLQAAPGTCRL